MESAKTWTEKVRKIGFVVAAALLIIICYLMYHAGRFKTITSMEAMDSGQIAWNLAEGRGYTTNLIRPLSLARTPQVDSHPDLTTAPLFPFVASLFMRVMPEKDKALALASGMGFLLTAPIIFFLGWQLFDIRSGMLATALYVTNLAYLRFSISGLPAPWLMLWCALLMLVCYTLSRKQRWRGVLAGLAGVIVALLYLTKYVWIAVLPLVLIYVFVSSEKHRRWINVGIFMAAFAVVIMPWCVRNMNVGGGPFFTFRTTELIMGTRSNPGNTLHRQFTTEYPSVVWYILDRPMEMLEKARNGLMELYGILPNLAGPFVTPFFLVAIVVTLGARTFERLRYLWYSMYALLALVLALTTPAEALLVPMAPLVLVVAAGFLLRLLDARLQDVPPRESTRYFRVLIGLLLVVHALPLGADLFRFKEVTLRDREALRQALSAREAASVTSGPIVTDVPWLIAWYADRPAIWLPKTRGDLRNMEDQIGKVRYLLLTRQVGSIEYDRFERMIKEWGAAWNEGIRGDFEFDGYRAAQRLTDNNWVIFQSDPQAKRDLDPAVMREYGLDEDDEDGSR